MAEPLPRRESLPVLYVKGSHYDVGYDIGRTFSAFIQKQLETHTVLNELYIPRYETKEGKAIYDETLFVVANKFPQYLRELEGMAEGADVPFYKLFLLHLDDIILDDSTNMGQGCSTLLISNKNQKIIGHTEDGLKESLNLCYIVIAHITESTPHEIFAAFCYPGLLPGYAMGFNNHFAFTMNIIAAVHTPAGKIPRTFLTRALYAADSFDRLEQILKCSGIGISDALSLNVMSLKKDVDDSDVYNIEVASNFPPTNESILNIKKVTSGEHYFHANKLMRLKVPEHQDKLSASSLDRHETEKKFHSLENLNDCINLLGDESCNGINIFRDRSADRVGTLAVGLFNRAAKSWSIYLGNPKITDPVLVLPLKLPTV